MSVEKEFERRGIELSEDNSLPPGARTQKNVKRLIAAVRAAEAQFNDELRDANDRCRRAQEHVIMLTERCHKLEDVVRRYRVANKLDGIESLTSTDRKLLLAASEEPINSEAA